MTNTNFKTTYTAKAMPIKKSPRLMVRELSLRPYNGRLFVATTRSAYERAHVKIFKNPDVLTPTQEGQVYFGEGIDGMWTYLVWAEKTHTMAHELSHVILHVFERCNIDPREGNGEPFCYMLSQLLSDIYAKPTNKVDTKQNKHKKL